MRTRVLTRFRETPAKMTGPESCERVAEMAGLTDESVCPTFGGKLNQTLSRS
jgi:hypothetical protein